MNKIGIYYGYWTKDWNCDIKRCILNASEIGFDILELSTDFIFTLSQYERDEIKKLAKEKNIILTFCTGLSSEYDIASKEKSIRQNGIEHIKKFLELVYSMGSNSFSGVNYAVWNGSMASGEYDKKPYLERSMESMKEIIKTSENYGIYYNIEVLNRFEQFMINTCKEAIEYVDNVGSPNLKILLDTYHMNIEEDNLKDAIVMAKDKLGHLHIGENNRRLPGNGHIQWDDVFSGLNEINYKGNIVMEPFVLQGGEIARDVRLYRDLNMNKDLNKEALKSLNFVKEKLNKAYK